MIFKFMYYSCGIPLSSCYSLFLEFLVFLALFTLFFYVLLRGYVHRCVRSISLAAIIIACSLVWWKSLLKRPVRLFKWSDTAWRISMLFLNGFDLFTHYFFILSLALLHTQNIFFVKLIFFVKWKVAKKNMFLPFLDTHKKNSWNFKNYLLQQMCIIKITNFLFT